MKIIPSATNQSERTKRSIYFCGASAEGNKIFVFQFISTEAELDLGVALMVVSERPLRYSRR